MQACHMEVLPKKIPVKANLQRRKIIDSGSCRVCNSEDETVTHALLLCPSVQNIWFASPLVIRIDASSPISFHEWRASSFQHADEWGKGLIFTLIGNMDEKK